MPTQFLFYRYPCSGYFPACLCEDPGWIGLEQNHRVILIRPAPPERWARGEHGKPLVWQNQSATLAWTFFIEVCIKRFSLCVPQVRSSCAVRELWFSWWTVFFEALAGVCPYDEGHYEHQVKHSENSWESLLANPTRQQVRGEMAV